VDKSGTGGVSAWAKWHVHVAKIARNGKTLPVVILTGLSEGPHADAIRSIRNIFWQSDLLEFAHKRPGPA
jgi:hypothetical protein